MRSLANGSLATGGSQLTPLHHTANTLALSRALAGGRPGSGGGAGGTAGAPMEEVAGAQDTIYLCNFRVSVDGEWLCLKELQDLDLQDGGGGGGGGGAVDGDGRALGHQQAGGGGGGGGGCDDGLMNYGIVAGGGERSGGGGGGDVGQRVDSWSNYSRDPAAIERSNLVNICKLVVKELLEQSLRFGRMLDSDHLPLQHFFIVLEHVLRHGLKPKKGLLGPKKELWDILQGCEKYCFEAHDITASVRDLPTVRTHMGRARAWLRIALMQKKLPDYLQALMENRDDALAEYYEPHALMMSEEVIVILGILVGLNVIDCNLCVKEEDLDSQQGVIDFSLYLRSSALASPTEEEQQQMATMAHNTAAIEGGGNMSAVLDQKNYIEELNRHLNATVGNLQSKVETLTTNNALMKEDLAIARNSLMALQAENLAMRQQHHSHPQHANGGQGGYSANDAHMQERLDAEMSEALAAERRKRHEVERELELQMSLKAETEMAMKLLEKDIHEKQDTIVSLRRQLDDIKAINLDMYRKLQECEATLRHKSDLLGKLESQKDSMAAAIAQLEQKYMAEMDTMTALRDSSATLSLQMADGEERVTRAETQLRIEHEWRTALQATEAKCKEQISGLQQTVKHQQDEARQHERVRLELERVRAQWSEAQTTLEELGIQLSVSKLQVSELQDASKASGGKGAAAGAQMQAQLAAQLGGGGGGGGGDASWTPDNMISNCRGCNREFGLTRRKHHCRNCGEIFCKACSEQLAPLPNEQGQFCKPVRVCDGCWVEINTPQRS